MPQFIYFLLLVSVVSEIIIKSYIFGVPQGGYLVTLQSRWMTLLLVFQLASNHI